MCPLGSGPPDTLPADFNADLVCRKINLILLDPSEGTTHPEGPIPLPPVLAPGHLSAISRTAKGNLVVTGYPGTSIDQLTASLPYIKPILNHGFGVPVESFSGTKWRHVCINGVPTPVWVLHTHRVILRRCSYAITSGPTTYAWPSSPTGSIPHPPLNQGIGLQLSLRSRTQMGRSSRMSSGRRKCSFMAKPVPCGPGQRQSRIKTKRQRLPPTKNPPRTAHPFLQLHPAPASMPWTLVRVLYTYFF
jgi:hypothetical protein